MHFSDQMALWTKGVGDQIAFWTVWTKSRGYKWPNEFMARLNPQQPIDPVISNLIPFSASTCRILDAGAGPLTCLGKTHPQGTPLAIEACDPLAKVYSALLQINGVTPLVETKFANVENLSAFYEANYYNITHCRNALDHSLDPLGGLIEMLRITKVGGYVVLDHELNEGINANYAGFHQYNFDIQDGRFVIWNPSMKIDVLDSLPIEAEISLSLDANGMFKAIIKKIGDFSDTDIDSHFRPKLRELLEYAFDIALTEGIRQGAADPARLSA